MEKLRISLLFIIIATLSAALFWLWFDRAREETPAAASVPHELAGIVLSQPKELPTFTLRDFDGNIIAPDWFRGQWTFVFFGYTHCPDICPTTLYTLQQVRRQLGRTAEIQADTRFLFVTLDPQRDSPDILKGYVQHFDTAFLAASTDHATLGMLTAALNIAYAIEHEPGSDNYVVNHSAAILLIDAQGRYHARYTPTQSATIISNTYRTLRDLHHR